jgi:cephalosporin-C deacetylase-like acetyl esterase
MAEGASRRCGLRVAVCLMACLCMLAGAAILAPVASAAIPRVFTGMSSPPVACSVQTGAGTVGQRWCSGSPSRVAAWDGTPIDVSVALPPAPAIGRDGNFPVVGIYHGWGGSKATPGGANPQRFLQRGYAVFSMTDRGWAQSCGTPASRSGLPAWANCGHGYIHLDDQAYEERDAQYLLGQLADEGVIDPNRIGATGGSYGGILSVQLAALNDRTRLPDGSLVPWVSPNNHIPMHIAGATPGRFASDIAYALLPNGSTLDYVVNSPYFGPQRDRRVGVQKQTILNGFYGNTPTPTNRYYAPVGTDPSADIVDWHDWTSPPGPFDNTNTIGAINELTAMHSAYYVDDSVAPAPMLMSNGLWDDFVPPDEAIRYYNKIRTHHPETPVAMFFGDVGHARSSDRDQAAESARDDAWLDHYVKGEGPPPPLGLEVYGMTCPTSVPTSGPYHFSSYADMEKGEVRLQHQAAQTIQATGTQFGTQLSQPAATSCTKVDATDNPATANYRTDAASGGGYTVAGSATVLAKFKVTGSSDQVAARLLDVGPDGQEQLVERALFRPQLDKKGTAIQVFQLHPNVIHIQHGHVLKLELLPDDYPYSILNQDSPDAAAQHPIKVSHLRLRVPVMDAPGTSGDLVRNPAEKFLPPGYTLARDFQG